MIMPIRRKNVITLTNEELRRMQLIQLDLLQEIDRICKKCNIKYAIIAGTLLGAVRHKGYIPWDDDADTAMLRDEYLKFREACKTELNTEKYFFQDHVTTPGYRWGFGRLMRKDTLYVRNNQEHMPYTQGVFVDIFPMDGVPDNYILRCLHCFKCFCVRKTMWSAVGRLSDKRPIMRKWFSLLYKIPEKTLYKIYEHLITTSNKKDTEYVRILTFPTPNKTFGYKRKWYSETAPIDFEGITFEGIKDYDDYLTFKFGDYMTLPPESERQGHHYASELKLL